jgi:uncharacterized membrane protein
VVEVLLWWLAFAGSHLILSSSWLRPRLIDPLTLWGYRALYSLVALATFLPLCFSYATVKGSGTLLFPALGHLPTCALMFVSVFFLLGSLVNPSPAGMVNTSLQAYGITKMTRHPFFIGAILFGLLHMLANPNPPDMVFFGGFVVYTIIGMLHMEKRFIAEKGEAYRLFCQETSILPFLKWHFTDLKEIRLLTWAVILTGFVLLVIFHDTLFL